jgi:hypothetical protein
MIILALCERSFSVNIARGGISAKEGAGRAHLREIRVALVARVG